MKYTWLWVLLIPLSFMKCQRLSRNNEILCLEFITNFINSLSNYSVPYKLSKIKKVLTNIMACSPSRVGVTIARWTIISAYNIIWSLPEFTLKEGNSKRCLRKKTTETDVNAYFFLTYPHISLWHVYHISLTRLHSSYHLHTVGVP